MNIDLTIITNYIYLLAGIYMIFNKKYLYGIIAIVIWLISHLYHLDKSNNFWSKSDEIFASIAFIYVLIRCKQQILCVKNITLLVILLIIHFIGRYYLKHNIDIYNIVHSIWHIYSAIFILYLIYENEK